MKFADYIHLRGTGNTEEDLDIMQKELNDTPRTGVIEIG